MTVGKRVAVVSSKLPASKSALLGLKKHFYVNLINV